MEQALIRRSSRLAVRAAAPSAACSPSATPAGPTTLPVEPTTPAPSARRGQGAAAATPAGASAQAQGSSALMHAEARTQCCTQSVAPAHVPLLSEACLQTAVDHICRAEPRECMQLAAWASSWVCLMRSRHRASASSLAVSRRTSTTRPSVPGVPAAALAHEPTQTLVLLFPAHCCCLSLVWPSGLSSVFQQHGLPLKLLAKQGSSAFHYLSKSIVSQQVSGKVRGREGCHGRGAM